MDELTRLAAQPLFMWFFGIFGDALLIIGIVTAAMDITIASFTPVLWFLLAINCYLGVVWIVALRILVNLESKREV